MNLKAAFGSLRGITHYNQPGVVRISSMFPGASFGGSVPHILRSNNELESPWVNSAFYACVNWMANTFPEADAVVQKYDPSTDRWKTLPREPLALMLNRPNPVYGGSTLWGATLMSKCAAGNSYWVKARDGLKTINGLWYYPHHAISPIWFNYPNAPYISYYETSVNGQYARIYPEDIVHFRNILDIDNPRMGLSPLSGFGLELRSDQEGARATDTMLHNLGMLVPLISPTGEVEWDEGAATAFKATYKESTTGKNRGDPVVGTAPFMVHQVGATPKDMAMDILRRESATRVCACLGIDPMVIGIQGLQQTYNNKAEARDAAYESFIIPTQKAVAETLSMHLLPDFYNDSSNLRVWFDLSDVRVLQDDEDKIAARTEKLYKSRIIDLYRAKERVGEIAQEADRGVYYVDSVVQQDSTPTEGAPVPSKNGKPQLVN